MSEMKDCVNAVGFFIGNRNGRVMKGAKKNVDPDTGIDEYPKSKNVKILLFK